MDVTKHCKRRYIERIMNETNDNEINITLSTQDERLTEHIQTLFSRSELIYQGAIGDNVTRKFWLKDDIVLITDIGENKLITLYRINFDFPKDINKIVINGLKDDIKNLYDSLEREKDNIDKESSENNIHIENYKKQIESLQTQIESIKFDIDELKSKNAKMFQNTQELHKRIDERAYQLFNSRQYSKDIKSGNL